MKGGRKQRTIIIAIMTVSIFLISIGYVTFRHTSVKNPVYGATYSTHYARSLGLDVEQTFEDLLKTFGFTHVRIPVYWWEVEPHDEQWNFEQLDALMQIAHDQGVSVTLAIGLKVPRWPECFIPDWVQIDNAQVFDQELFSMITAVVDRYKGREALLAFQVENEPFFPFGECPAPDAERFSKTIQSVRTLAPDTRIVSTTSGEQALWFLRARGVDALGVSIYREVWNSAQKPFVFPHSPWIYRLQSWMARVIVKDVFISELQMEPWIPEDLALSAENRETLFERFCEQDMRSALAFAQATGIQDISMWGVEWWAYLKAHGDERLWNTAKELFPK